MDKMVKDRISQESVKLDKSLARLQALILDAVGPMATILEEGEKAASIRRWPWLLPGWHFDFSAMPLYNCLGRDASGL